MSAARFVTLLVCVAVAGAALAVYVVRVGLGLVQSVDGSAFLALASLFAAAVLVLPWRAER